VHSQKLLGTFYGHSFDRECLAVKEIIMFMVNILLFTSEVFKLDRKIVATSFVNTSPEDGVNIDHALKKECSQLKNLFKKFRPHIFFSQKTF